MTDRQLSTDSRLKLADGRAGISQGGSMNQRRREAAIDSSKVGPAAIGGPDPVIRTLGPRDLRPLRANEQAWPGYRIPA